MGCTWRLAGLGIALALSTAPAWASSLTFDDRVAAQRAIEDVYWRHRLWPSENVAPKPPLEHVMSQASLESRVESYLKKSNALATLWHRPITREQLQAELDRMARDSRDPKLLRELFDALGNDADLVAETLARPILVERLIRNWLAAEAPQSFDAWWNERKAGIEPDAPVVARGLALPSLPAGSCTNDTWKPTHMEVPDGRVDAYAVWTGTEMIVWGGGTTDGTGGRYNPATDAWVAMSISPNAKSGFATVVWTGTEMIVWGGSLPATNTGVRYDPTNDTWAATSVGANVPAPRLGHTAVWTGSQMIVWGGTTADVSARRYDPVTDTWSPPSSILNAPGARSSHSAVWTGMEMIVWGGSDSNGISTSTGARYNPVADTWTPTGLGANLPAARLGASAVWTGSAMVVWGGRPSSSSSSINSGGRYDPVTDSWQPTSQGSNVPSPRGGHTTVWTGSRMIIFGGNVTDPAAHAYDPTSDSWQTSSPLGSRARHVAVWTGSEMIVWGGFLSGHTPYNTGARYNPVSDSWVMTSMGSVPVQREAARAVWTGTEMIVWGGKVESFSDLPVLNSGGRYSPATDSWVPTSLNGVPAARHSHAAVWTGTEMIVWGGLGTIPFNSGGRYDPLTDSWRPTSVGANVPTPRTPPSNQPVVVWSGREMILFGDATQTGGRYDPVSDAWGTTAVGPALGAGDRTAVWSGSEMIVYQGGYGAAGRYNPLTNSWTAMPPAPLSNRFDSTTVWTGTEMIVWGGNDSNTGARYNPAMNAWTPTSTGANVATARSAHSAAWTGSEMLVWGGANFGSTSDPTRGGRYDPLTDTWQSMSLGPDQPTPERTLQASVWTGSQLIVWGGQATTATGGVYCACPDGRLVYRDADGDGYGDARITAPSCDGSMPAGYSADALDCNDAQAAAHPGALETCNAADDDCDGLVDELVSVEDTDADALHDACDNCASTFNPTQTDSDEDGEGDACDVDDGVIFVYGPDDAEHIQWRAEAGPTSWNVYQGDLAVLKITGTYTQTRSCGIVGTVIDDPLVPPAGAARFVLVTGVSAGIEGSLGTNSSGGERPNSDPCP